MMSTAKKVDNYRFILGVEELGVLGDLQAQHSYVSPVKNLASSVFNDEILDYGVDPKTLVVYDLFATDKIIEVNGEKVQLTAFEQGLIISYIIGFKRFPAVKKAILDNAKDVLSADVYNKVFLKLDWMDPHLSFNLGKTVAPAN